MDGRCSQFLDPHSYYAHLDLLTNGATSLECHSNVSFVSMMLQTLFKVRYTIVHNHDQMQDVLMIEEDKYEDGK